MAFLLLVSLNEHRGSSLFPLFRLPSPVFPLSSSASVKASPSRRRRRQTVYRVRNGAAYDAGLKQRGSLTTGLTLQAIKAWYYRGPTQRNSSYTYSALAIQTALMMSLLYPLPLRQTEGFLRSILALMGVD